MQHVLKCLDIMSRHRHFLLFVAGHGEEKGAVVLGLDFVNHGEVHDVALMGTEEAQGGEEVFYVPEGHVLPLGDNRDNSQDGRYFGPINADNINGKVVFRIWPLNRIRSLIGE